MSTPTPDDPGIISDPFLMELDEFLDIIGQALTLAIQTSENSKRPDIVQPLLVCRQAIGRLRSETRGKRA
jgi:hypothetical protein